jgi:hypothetical protein
MFPETSDAATPLTVTEATPAPLSLACMMTVTGEEVNTDSIVGLVICIVGETVSTSQDAEGGVVSALPAASVDLTSNRWAPSLKAEYAAGEVQDANAEPSRLHSDTADSEALNTNEADVDFVCAAGADVIVVIGAVLSILNVEETTVSWFPALSTDFTEMM